MKVLFQVMLFSVLLFPQSGWFWQNPIPQGLNLYDIDFVSPTEFFAVGSSGVIIKYSKSAGWNQVYHALEIKLSCIKFINSS